MNIIRNFVILEGGDGSGTTTQLDLLRRRFSPLPAGNAPAPGSSSLPPLYPTFSRFIKRKRRSRALAAHSLASCQ